MYVPVIVEIEEKDMERALRLCAKLRKWRQEEVDFSTFFVTCMSRGIALYEEDFAKHEKGT